MRPSVYNIIELLINYEVFFTVISNSEKNSEYKIKNFHKAFLNATNLKISQIGKTHLLIVLDNIIWTPNLIISNWSKSSLN